MGSPVTSSPGAPSESPAGPTPSPRQPAPCTPSNQDAFVYKAARLKVLAPCIRVSGTISSIRKQADGDRMLLVLLDPEYAHLLSPGNARERNHLIVEVICVGPITQADAKAGCAANTNPLTVLPAVGQHVVLDGRYVLDLEHDSWAELHPLYRWQPA